MTTFNQYLITESILTYDSLMLLILGEILAIKIPNYYNKLQCDLLSQLINQKMSAQSNASGNIYESDMESFWNTIDNVEIKKQYFNKAVTSIREWRNATYFTYPSDKIRLEIDEIWPTGANLMRIDTMPMLFGIIRRWREGFEALPHQDILNREITTHAETSTQMSQLGVNVYLNSAEEGGELELWNYSVQDSEYEKFVEGGVKNSYGFDRAKIPAAALNIKPNIGDLILINTTNVHAIKKVIKGQRLTVSGFVGCFGLDKPLKLWS